MHKLAVGVLAATLALAACGGSSKKSVNPAAGGTSVTTTKGGGSGSSDDLSKLAAEYAKAKIKITYQSTGGTAITLAQDGNGRSAFGTGSGTFYTDGKTSVSCEGTGPTAKCIDMSSLGSTGGANIGSTFTAGFAGIASLFSSLGGGEKSSETIAGRDASCVQYKASDALGQLSKLSLFKDSVKASDYDPNDTLKICLDKQTGFLLKVAGTKKGKAEEQLTATAVSEPSDSDFTPPVTPETIPSPPGGVTTPSIPSP
jgi:hypothetical protein